MIQNSQRLIVLIAIFFSLQTQFAFAQESESQPSTKSNEVVEATDIGTAPDQKAIDNLKKFLAGSKWNGTFTMTGKGDKLHTEEYEIVSAEKEPTGDEWVLIAKIKYMKKDVKVPVPLSIKWLDRTPIIVVDQMTIPGMGTFDSRVIIRKGMYAGTWAHGKVGGHLFGDITTAAAAAEKAKTDEKK